jgi:hypothetical protein
MMIKTDFYTLTPYQNLLHIKTYFSWDERVVTEYIHDLSGLVQHHYQGKFWAVIHDATNYTLSTPRAEQMLVDFVTSKNTGSITHHALVTGPAALNKWQADNVMKGVTAYACKNFERFDDALQWLNSAGYDMVDPC